jgi:dephospho-CoA kinase
MSGRGPGAPATLDLPVVIGLTGPIGCGKSTVARMLADLGGTVIDADELAREVTAPGEPALSAIRARFGDRVLGTSGALDRAALAAVVFSDAAALRDLEAIVHPHVRARVEALLERARADAAPFVAIEAIKLVEGGLAGRCHEVWVIDCSADEQRQRLLGRGLTEADMERRMAAQGHDLAERLARRADRRIVTSGSLERVRERVEDALADVLEPVIPGLPIGPVERSSGPR